MVNEKVVSLVQNSINKRICEYYLITNIIGYGGYGATFVAKHSKDNTEVVVKIEFKKSCSNSLENECEIYRQLGIKNYIPKIITNGTNELGNFLVMEQLGSNLEQLMRMCGNRFSLKSVIMLAHTLLLSLKKMHKKNVLHRDIKPENIVTGLNNRKNRLYFIDFGLSEIYNPNATKEIKHRLNRFHGSMEFCSVNVHKGMDFTPKDDLESLGYIFIYFLKGSLPWSIPASTNITQRELERFVFKKKMNTSLHDLCDQLPREFMVFFLYTQNLKPLDIPNYTYLRFLFRNLFDRLFEAPMDHKYDWCD